ncbi:acyltransferase family protein [Pantoea agglomerans]|uniref:acyltransferase family protein n=1 Tax=Enterobacter agglomerans TaxID=549 RepID=UPI001F44BA01|nr:acyltransferase [Pantoea agglomerans]UJL36110.1 acyltransferase [Pantoea agglomerans]
MLAILVLLSHCGIKLPGYNQGVTAVVSFLIISGYVITKLISAKFPDKSDIKPFYLDRALRLFPQFIFYLILTSVLYIIFDGTEKITISQFFVNALMLPLNTFAVYNNDYIIVPQSWSLGLELQFYLLIPFILLSKKKATWAVASIILFLPAYLGIVNTDYFGYRMLTGTLFIFLLGSMMAGNERRSLWVIYAVSAVMLVLAVSLDGLSHEFNKEVLSGVLIGVPTVWLLFKVKIRNKWDSLAGDLSYGVYLNHLMFFYAYNKLGFHVLTIEGAMLIMGSSLTMSYISLRIIEQPFYKIRHKRIRKDLPENHLST